MNNQNNLTKFDAKQSNISKYVSFQDWATVPAIRIVGILELPNIGYIFSLRGIAKMIGCPLSTTIRAMHLLIGHQIILQKENNYYLNQTGIACRDSEGDPKMDRGCSKNGSKGDPKMDRGCSKNGTTIDKINIKNNIKKEIKANALDFSAFETDILSEIVRYADHRAQIKKPLTQNALFLLRDKIKNFTKNEIKDAVDASILNRWVGLFPKSISSNTHQVPPFQNKLVSSPVSKEVSTLPILAVDEGAKQRKKAIEKMVKNNHIYENALRFENMTEEEHARRSKNFKECLKKFYKN